jgi:hypothetical protein
MKTALERKRLEKSITKEEKMEIKIKRPTKKIYESNPINHCSMA